MCYNCGCGVPDAGAENSITEETFREAAKNADQDIKEAKKNTLKLLQETMKNK